VGGKGIRGARLKLVDMNTAWSTLMFTQADGIHPNTDGEIQLAQRWANALISTGMITPSVQPPVPVTTVTTVAPTIIPTAVPTAVITASPTAILTTASTAAITTRSAFGSKRYVLRPGAAGSGLTSSRTANSIGTGSSRGSQAAGTNPLVPPTRQFQRWYPEQRWANGIR
jgi:hypothetical protein